MLCRRCRAPQGYLFTFVRRVRFTAFRSVSAYRLPSRVWRHGRRAHFSTSAAAPRGRGLPANAFVRIRHCAIPLHRACFFAPVAAVDCLNRKNLSANRLRRLAGAAVAHRATCRLLRSSYEILFAIPLHRACFFVPVAAVHFPNRKNRSANTGEQALRGRGIG